MFAWTGAALFAASLTCFVFSYVVRFANPAGGGAGAAAWNVAIFTVFALHHSLFARTPIRALVSRVASPARERVLYVWVASLLFIAVCALWRPVAGTLWVVDGAGRLVLLGLQALGAVLTLRSAAIIDIWELAGIVPAQPAVFRASGPYAWVRHPIYSGWFLFVWAVPAMTMTRFVFAAASCAYLLAAIPLEERTLRAASDGAYDRYMRQVRWKLVPGIY